MPRRRTRLWGNLSFILATLASLSILVGMRTVVSSFSIPADTVSEENPTLPSDSSTFRVEFPLCLVHVGKAAGSSVSCGLGLTYADCEGMPRDKLEQTYHFHMRRNNCPSNTRSYAVTLRNPITRLQSWFDFEKNIVPTRKNKHQEEQMKRKRGMLFTECYSDFGNLATTGLQPLQEEVSVAKPINMTCPQRAWAAALGVRAFSYHEWYNYEHYWTGIQNHPGFENRSSVHGLRMEHLIEDWSTVTTEKLFRPVNQGSSSKSSKTLSSEAMINLCRALCPEIQIYKQFLQLADNLEDVQVEESIREVQVFCPLETRHIRECPEIPTFPKLNVPRQQYKAETKKRLFQIMPNKN